MSRILLVAALALALSLGTAQAQDRTAQAPDSAQAKPDAAAALRPSLPPWLITPSLLGPDPATLSRDSSVWAPDLVTMPRFDCSSFVTELAVAASIRLSCGDDTLCQRYMASLYEDRHGEISVWADMTAWVLSSLLEDWLGDTAPLAHSPSRWRLPDPP